jgi:FkbM family methyltransferase
MTFLELKALYKAGEMSKAEFIETSLACHRALFDYTQVLRSTDVNEIRISRDGVAFSVGVENILLNVPPGESRVVPLEVMNFDSYEPAENRVMDYLSAGARCILDVGANIGWYSVRFATRDRQAHVYAFEPMPVTYAYLQRNIAANRVGGQVATFNYGLSNSGGAVTFYLAPTSGTNASLKNVADNADAVPVVGLTMTMDQWVANQAVSPDFIKCDVEGAELLVFQGGRQTLVTHRPVVFTELLRKWAKPFGYHPNDLLLHFADLGYSCFAIGSEGARPIDEVTEETIETNYAFLHKTEHALLIQGLQV